MFLTLFKTTTVAAVIAVSGVSATGAIGTVTATGSASVSVTGVDVLAALGTVTASGTVAPDAVVFPTGVTATAAVGTVTAQGTGTAPIVPDQGGVGPPPVWRIDAQVAVRGVAGRVALGPVAASGRARVRPVGVLATTAVGPGVGHGAAGVPVTTRRLDGRVGRLAARGQANVAAVVTGVVLQPALGRVVFAAAWSAVSRESDDEETLVALGVMG